MKKMAILLVGMLVVSAFLVAGNSGTIEKFRVGFKNGECKDIVYMNPASVAAIYSRATLDTDRGKLTIDTATKALYDEGGTLVATRLANSEYIPAGFDKNKDGMLRGEEAAAYSRYVFSRYSGNADVKPSTSVWDAYVKANGEWMPAGIDNPYTPLDEALDAPQTGFDRYGAGAMVGLLLVLLAGAFGLYLMFRSKSI